MELSFESFGDGPPVLILRGLFASGSCCCSVACRLSAQHRVIAVDLPNHGRSPSSDRMSYADMAADVLALMKRESLQPSTVIGHCIGGKVAMAMALTAPATLHRLCVIEAAPHVFLDPWMHQLRAMRRSLAIDGGSAVLAACRAGADGSLLSRFLLPRATLENPYVDWRCNLGAIAPCIPQLREFPEALQVRRCPLVLHSVLGSESSFVRPADTTVFRPMFPHVRMEVIQDAGHWLHATCPDELSESLQRLLGTRDEPVGRVPTGMAITAAAVPRVAALHRTR